MDCQYSVRGMLSDRNPNQLVFEPIQSACTVTPDRSQETNRDSASVMPANEVLKRLGIRSKGLEAQFTGEGWHWSTMAYYLGQEPDLYDRVIKYAWLDHAPLPWQVKAVWAHHRYLLGKVK